MPATRTIGLILAGGRSTRMGGRDKALVPLHGEPLLAHMIRRLRPQVNALVLNSNADPLAFQAFGLQVLADAIGGFQGPLAGIHAGLQRYPQDNLLTVAVDLPLLPVDLVSRLHSGLVAGQCSYASDGQQHTLALLWSPGMAPQVEDYLRRGGRSLRDFLSGHGQPVRFDRPADRGLFRNLNSPADLAAAEQDVDLLNS